MDLRQLATFQMLARTLSFTRTAAALSYVQSTVTAQIQALEGELNVRLFDRLGRRIVLTEAGARLLGYADRILALADEAQRAVGQQGEPVGTLTVSAAESLCIYTLPSLISAMRQRAPLVRLLFRPGVPPQQRRLVSEGSIDLAFVLDDPMHSTEIAVEQLRREPVLLVAAPEHPLAQEERIGPADLRGAAIVLTEAGCSYRLKFERAVAAAGLHLDPAWEFSSVDAIKQCVINGMGIGVLPERVVAQELAEGRLAALPWAGADLTVVMQLLWHPDRWCSPAMQICLALARALFRDQPLAESGPDLSTVTIHGNENHRLN